MNHRQFGNFELDLETGELRRAGIKLRLQDKPFQLLALLLERPGKIVSREAVRDRLWPADTSVDFDHSLNTAVRKLRMDHHVAYSLGAAFAQLGRKGEAVTWLRTAIDEGFPCYPWFVQDPMLEPIREDEGYRNLMRDLQGRFETARSRYGARAQ